MKFLSHRKPFPFFALFAMILITVLIFTLSTRTTADSKGVAASTPKGQTLYTQFSLYHEDNRHVTTNYRKGILVPVNTEVKFVKADSESIVVTLPDGQKLTIENIERFSGEGIDGIFTRTFAANPVDLSKFTADEKKAIMEGSVKLGMRKSAVIVALGYPPKHKTPNLEMDQWRYWKNRFMTFIVNFENDRVVRID